MFVSHCQIVFFFFKVLLAKGYTIGVLFIGTKSRKGPFCVVRKVIAYNREDEKGKKIGARYSNFVLILSPLSQYW